jgi:hypothetical protein
MKCWGGSITHLRTFSKHLFEDGENHILVVEVHQSLRPTAAFGLN